jgi:hypothetical protein
VSKQQTAKPRIEAQAQWLGRCQNRRLTGEGSVMVEKEASVGVNGFKDTGHKLDLD